MSTTITHPAPAASTTAVLAADFLAALNRHTGALTVLGDTGLLQEELRDEGPADPASADAVLAERSWPRIGDWVDPEGTVCLYAQVMAPAGRPERAR